MSWGEFKDIKGAQIMRILNEFSDYVRNIFASILLPWYLKSLEGENVNQIRMGAARWQLKYSMLYL